MALVGADHVNVTLGPVSVLPAVGEINAAGVAVTAHDLQLEVVDLAAAKNGLQRICQGPHVPRRSQFQQRAPEKFALLEASFIPAAVGVADQTGGVCDKNQALSIAKNFSREIAFAL